MSQASQMLTRRPSLVTFAAIMMFVVAGFQIVFAFSEFFNATWLLSTTYGTFGGYLWLWGILDLLLAFIPLYAGYDLLQGGQFGFIVGIVISGFSARNSGSVVMNLALLEAQAGPEPASEVTSGRSNRYDCVSALANSRGVSLMFDVTCPAFRLMLKPKVIADTVIGA